MPKETAKGTRPDRKNSRTPTTLERPVPRVRGFLLVDDDRIVRLSRSQLHDEEAFGCGFVPFKDAGLIPADQVRLYADLDSGRSYSITALRRSHWTNYQPTQPTLITTMPRRAPLIGSRRLSPTCAATRGTVRRGNCSEESKPLRSPKSPLTAPSDT